MFVLLENILIKNVIFPKNTNFISINSSSKNLSFTNITLENSYLNSSIFLQSFSSVIYCEHLNFFLNNLTSNSYFFLSNDQINIKNSLFSFNYLSNSTMISLKFFNKTDISTLLESNEFSYNLCEKNNDITIYFLMIISLSNSPFFLNSSIFSHNFCRSPFILINNTFHSISFKTVSFIDNYSSKLVHFFVNLNIFIDVLIIQNTNNSPNPLQTESLSLFLIEFAGSCLFFETILNLTITNSIFSDSFSSILPTILAFQEDLLFLTPFLLSFNQKNPIISIKNTKFLNNFFDYSDKDFPNKDQGCSITSTSIAFLTIKDSLFLNNTFNIPNNPIKGGPGLNINNEEASLLLENCGFFQNQANFQSNSLFFLGYNLTIISSNFSQNKEFSQINVKLTGGVYMIFTYAFLYNCTFSSNKGYNGGLSISLGPFSYQILTINLTKFIDNWASYTGAGINFDETGLNRTCMIFSSEFLSNYADNYAAAVFIFGAGVTLSTNISFFSCVFDNNIAVWEGGAFSIWLYYPFYSIFFYECIFNGSKLIGTGNSIMGACLDFWGDSSWIKTEDLSIIKTFSCVFNNSFSFTGSGLYIVTAIYYDFNTTFNMNFASKEGGTILLSDNAQIYLNYTRIFYSKALYSAGGIGGKEQVKVFLFNVVFMNSYAKSGAGVYLDSNSLLFADNLTFSQNEGEVGSAILIRNTNNLVSYLNNSRFINNTGSYSVIQIEYSTLFMKNSTLEFSNVACFSTYSSILFLYNFVFQHNYCIDQITGCSFFIRESSNILLFDSQMLDIHGKSVGAIFIEFSSLKIYNSSFVACLSDSTGDIISSTFSNIFLEKIIIKNFVTTPFDLKFSGFVIKESEIDNEMNMILGSFIQCFDCESLLIESTNFYRINSTGKGAGIYLENNEVSTLKTQSITVNNCSFKQLIAENGGAFYLKNINILIYNTYFYGNSAENGGSIYFSCFSDFLLNCSINLTNNSFISSIASIEGGALKWTGKKPENIPRNFFQSNRAKYGGNIASFPVRFGVTIIQKSDNKTIYDSLLNDSQAFYVPNQQSGGKFKHNLFFYFLDENNEKIQTIQMDYLKIDIYKGTIPLGFLNNSFINLTHDEFYNGNSSVIFGETFQIINEITSSFLISDLTLIGTPTTVLYLQISTMYTTINPEFKANKYMNNPHDLYIESTNEYFYILPVVLSECSPGEIYNATDNKCVECVSGKYSFSPRDPLNYRIPSQCLACIADSSCPGGSIIILDEGYWRKDKLSKILYKCNWNSMSCLGGYESVCAEEYAGSLCESCSNEGNITRSKNFMDLCQECPNVAVNIVIEIILLVILIIWVLICDKFFRTTKVMNKEFRFLVKLLINYLQFIYISGSFNVQLPIAIKVYISVFEIYTLITRNWINSGCLFSDFKITENPQFSHLIAGYCFIVLIFLFTFILKKFSIFPRNKEDIIESSRGQKTDLFITICYLFNGPMIFLALHSFKCIEIEGTHYLESSPDYECYGAEHLLIIVFFSLPILLLFAIIFPLVIKMLYLGNGVENLTYKYRKIWNIGYIRESKKIYFEFLLLGVKYILIGVVVFFEKDNIKKSITCFFILLTFTQAFLIVKPFKYKFFTQMSILAFSAISSMYLSLVLYYSESSSPKTRVAFVTMMLMLNTLFIVMIFYYMINVKRKRKTKKKIMKKGWFLLRI